MSIRKRDDLLFFTLMRRKRVKEATVTSWDWDEGDWSGFSLVDETFGIRNREKGKGLEPRARITMMVERLIYLVTLQWWPRKGAAYPWVEVVGRTNAELPGSQGTFECNLHFPSGAVVKNLPTNTGDVGLIPGWGRSPGEGNGNPLQCSCLENPTDRGDWWVSKEADTSEQLHNRSSKNHTVWLLRWKSWASNERAFKKTFYWSIVALQCYVSFYCAMKWANCGYTYTPSFLDFRPI